MILKLMETDDFYMGEALAAAREGLAAGEVPVGAVVVGEGGEILARAFNQPIAPERPHGPRRGAGAAAGRAVGRELPVARGEPLCYH